METKHTPGPWRIEEWEFKLRPNAPMILAKQDAICEVMDLWCMNDRAEERDANARLIAAAPDLYEALELARKSLRFAAPGQNRALAKIEAALAKARGEQ